MNDSKLTAGKVTVVSKRDVFEHSCLQPSPCFDFREASDPLFDLQHQMFRESALDQS